MPEREVRSPWSRRGEPHPRLAKSPGSRSSPSGPNYRSDGGHIALNVGKNGLTNPKLMRDNGAPSPVTGEPRDVIADRR